MIGHERVIGTDRDDNQSSNAEASGRVSVKSQKIVVGRAQRFTGILPIAVMLVSLPLAAHTPPAHAADGWVELSLPHRPGQVGPSAYLATDAAGTLYVAEYDTGRVQKRSADGTWSVLAAHGEGPDRVNHPIDLALDGRGRLVLIDGGAGVLKERDLDGTWRVAATAGRGLGEVDGPRSLAFDRTGALYVADTPNRGNGRDGRIQRRDPAGNWSVVATNGAGLGQVREGSIRLDTDADGSLYVSEQHAHRVQKRDPAGRWSVVAEGSVSGRVIFPTRVLPDPTGDLYLVDGDGDLGRILRRAPGGAWSIVASFGEGTGRIGYVGAVGVDVAGALYVADSVKYKELPPGDPNAGPVERPPYVPRARLQRRDPDGTWTELPLPETPLFEGGWSIKPVGSGG